MTPSESAGASRFIDDYPSALIVVTPEGAIVEWNREAERMFGYTRDEVVGLRLAEVLSGSDGDKEREAWNRAIRGDGIGFYESRRRRRDGTILLLDANVRAIRDEDGTTRYLALSKMDVTRLRYRREAEILETRYRGLLEAAPDAMVLLNEEGRIVLATSQALRLFGYDRDELLGEVVEVLVPPRFRARHPSQRTGYFADPRPRPMGAGVDLAGLRKDGSEFPTDISLSPVRTEDGRMLVSAAIRDVSERRQHEQRKAEEREEQKRRIEEASRLKSEFMANMSHELRTPLNAIIGFARLMHTGAVGPVAPNHQEYLGDILSSANHLLQLINDVLDLSKIEAGKMELRVEAIDPRALVREVCESLRALAAQKAVHLVFDLAPDLDTVICDPSRLRQVLYNYLSNAIKFSPDGAEVHIRSSREGSDRFRLEVEDHGVGIAAKDLGRLFVEFQQLDGGSTKRFPGTGLGLALTRRIVHALGGEVGVESELGRGSRFFAVLPLAGAGSREEAV